LALVRLGDDSGRGVLLAALERPAEAYLSTLNAAGYLAQSGDPRGLPRVAAALNSKLDATRMLACKQLSFFWPYHGPPPDILALFRPHARHRDKRAMAGACADTPA